MVIALTLQKSFQRSSRKGEKQGRTCSSDIISAPKGGCHLKLVGDMLERPYKNGKRKNGRKWKSSEKGWNHEAKIEGNGKMAGQGA